MTDPFARPTSPPADDSDLTIPLVPDAGYAQPAQTPFGEETLVEPLPDVSWGVAAQDFGYTPTPARPASGGAPSEPAYVQPSPYLQPGPYPQPAPYPPSVPFAEPEPAQPGGYAWPSAATSAAPEPNYRQPEVGGGVAAYQAYPPGPSAAPAAAPWTAAAPVPYTFSTPTLPEHPSATPALVLGILGIVGFWPLGPIAWFLGAKGKREIRQNPGQWRPSATLTAGRVLGAITTIVMALTILAITMFVFFVISVSS